MDEETLIVLRSDDELEYSLLWGGGELNEKNRH